MTDGWSWASVCRVREWAAKPRRTIRGAGGSFVKIMEPAVRRSFLMVLSLGSMEEPFRKDDQKAAIPSYITPPGQGALPLFEQAI